jgi:hypothetical protein
MNTVKVRHSNGGTDYLVRINKFRLSDVIEGASDTVHPAFIVDGKEIDCFYFGKFGNSVHNGVPYSLPYQKPAANITYDKAIELCERKGKGWHLITNAEWSAITLIIQKIGKQPHGCTSKGGMYHADHTEKGMTYDGYDTLTGSGPDTWAHDGTEDGIYDLSGNIGEWVSGLRITNGKVQIIPDNNASLAIDKSENSSEWKDTGYGYLLSDDNIKIVPDTEISDNYGGGWFREIVGNDVPEIFEALALAPTTGNEQGYAWIDNEETERLPIRGGYWGSGALAGVFALHLSISRSHVHSGIGFRSAFIGDLESAEL